MISLPVCCPLMKNSKLHPTSRIRSFTFIIIVTMTMQRKKLEEIIIDFRSCPVEEMSPFTNTLINWKNEIINSFIIVDNKSKRRMNTAIVENRNKTIKLIKHASNGYLNWERFRNRILYTLNDDTTYYFACIRKDRN